MIPRAVIGFWPWATAKVVITPAPRQATASWVTVEGRLFTRGKHDCVEIKGIGAAILPLPGLRYLVLVFVTCRNLTRQQWLPLLVACGFAQAKAHCEG